MQGFLRALPRAGTPEIPERGRRMYAAWAAGATARQLTMRCDQIYRLLRNDHGLSAEDQETTLRADVADVRRLLGRITAAVDDMMVGAKRDAREPERKYGCYASHDNCTMDEGIRRIRLTYEDGRAVILTYCAGAIAGAQRWSGCTEIVDLDTGETLFERGTETKAPADA